MTRSNKFENQMVEKILESFPESNAQKLISAYDSSRTKLVENIYGEIKRAEPDLSDHGERHIDNVLDNTFYLLAEDEKLVSISAIEAYCLGMFILFHDVGNLYGRENHNNKITDIFGCVRGNGADILPERRLVLTATRAHTGIGSDGSKDTLADINDSDHLQGNKVRLRELAAILRFADELAEGPQRTSEFLRQNNMYMPEAKIFHDYAASTNIFIDRGGRRIAINYEIEITELLKSKSSKENLHDFLKFIYSRVIKLDQERRYTRFYTSMLEPFASTEVVFNFHFESKILETGLLPLVLTDKVVPGDQAKQISEINPLYEIDSLLETLSSAQEA